MHGNATGAAEASFPARRKFDSIVGERASHNILTRIETQAVLMERSAQISDRQDWFVDVMSWPYRGNQLVVTRQ